MLVNRLGGDSSAIDIDTFIILDARLGTLDGAWRHGQSADANISFLLDKVPKPAFAAAGLHGGADDAAVASIEGGGAHLARMASLETDLGAWMAQGDDADPMEAITIIYESECSAAIRWLQGTAAVSGLPPMFKQALEKLPGKIDEYILAAIMHDETACGS